MRILTLIFLITFSSCKETISQEKNNAIEIQNLAENTALEFINKYVEYCNSNSDKELIEWILEQKNVTENFKTELKKIIEKAKKEDPELGLGFDPIFNAQDYPEKGFTLEKSKSEYINVKGIDWESFKLKIKMKHKNNLWLVNGIGIINMPKE